MRRSPRLPVVLAATVLVAAALAAVLGLRSRSASPDITWCGPPDAPAAVLIVHGGSFAGGSSADTQDTCAAMGAAGLRAANLDYPLLDLAGAREAVLAAAALLRRHHARVYAYGESAGGGLAALLAAQGRVDGAYAWAPVSDLVRWRAESVPGFVSWAKFADRSPALLRRLSAVTYAGPRSAPMLVEHGREDVHVPGAQSVRLKRRWPAMTLRWVPGGHLPGSPGFRHATGHALAWLRAREAAATGNGR